ncbi:MAG: hypothetical protein IJ466_07380 [Clostridia bacterium]|nr:hypothetical protein [Clostridia bacterium]
MAIESKNLLVWLKAMSRGQALPLDASEVYGSLAEAQAYASGSAIAYPGQTIKALLEDGTYHSYVLQPGESGYTLTEVGAVSASDLKQYVQVVSVLPDIGMEEGVLYICGTTGSIWTGSAWKQVFWDVSAQITALEQALDGKAPIADPVFTGTVKVGNDEVALKSWVEGMFANLASAAPKLVDSANPIPEGYKAGEHYRVAEAGTYAGQACEAGDLIIVIADYDADTASDADFIVLQSNIDGAVTSAADAVTVGEIVVFDAVTGKVIKGGGVQIASLNDAITKAHEHANKTALDSYDKTQSELLEAAKGEAQALVTEAVKNKADKATTLAGYGIIDGYTKTEIDGKLTTINENLNSKASSTEVDTKIAAAKDEILGDAATAASQALEDRVGNIPADTTIAAYIDTAVGSGGTASAAAIATAKQEAIDTSNAYTDAALTVTEF